MTFQFRSFSHPVSNSGSTIAIFFCHFFFCILFYLVFVGLKVLFHRKDPLSFFLFLCGTLIKKSLYFAKLATSIDKLKSTPALITEASNESTLEQLTVSTCTK
jgi:hypothetical protein